MNLLVFELNNQLYGLDFNKISEVSAYTEMLTKNDRNALVEGDIERSGHQYKIINLRTYFDLQNYTIHERPYTQILYTSSCHSYLGLLVDHSHSIHLTDGEDLEVMQKFPESSALQSIIRLEGLVVKVLNLETLISQVNYSVDFESLSRDIV